MLSALSFFTIAMSSQSIVPAPYPNTSLGTFSLREERKEYWEPIFEGTVTAEDSNKMSL